jgi:hypothetical protein
MASSTSRPDIFAIRGRNDTVEAQLTVRDWSKTSRSSSVGMGGPSSFFDAEASMESQLTMGLPSL